MRTIYGITLEEYAAKQMAQGGGCALCGGVHKKRWLHVDHDHKTGKVRGLLCIRCNVALERVEEVTGWIEKVQVYLSNG
jgi:hypothetical protein